MDQETNIPQPIRGTYEQYQALDEDMLAEFVDGMIYFMARPSLEHTEIVGNIYFALRTYLKGKKCKVLIEPEVALYATDKHSRVPDLVVNYKHERYGDGKRLNGTPELVIEVVSPSSIDDDYVTKRMEYQLSGAKEYWIVNPEGKSMTFLNFDLADDTIPFGQVLKHAEDLVPSQILPDLRLTLEEIFARE
jgi:Uma2 family endonuclease